MVMISNTEADNSTKHSPWFAFGFALCGNAIIFDSIYSWCDWYVFVLLFLDDVGKFFSDHQLKTKQIQTTKTPVISHFGLALCME